MRKRSVLRSLGGFAAGTALVFGALVADSPASSAQEGGYQKGPDPTTGSITSDGSYDVDSTGVAFANGFGGGTIYYPEANGETFGAIAVSPGFMSPGSLMSWAGPRLASHGFVVMIMNTNTVTDFPDSRARQLRAALDHMIADGAVGPMIDESRLGVMGHSMGGGGSLIVAEDNPDDIKAAVPLQPWQMFGNFRGMQTPTLVIGAQNDIIASVGSHAEPHYESIPDSTPKAYLELGGQGHLVGVSNNATQSAAALVWFKRFIDDDTRYDQFLCPPAQSSSIEEYRENCPYPGGTSGGASTPIGGDDAGDAGEEECGFLDELLGQCNGSDAAADEAPDAGTPPPEGDAGEEECGFLDELLGQCGGDAADEAPDAGTPPEGDMGDMDHDDGDHDHAG